MTRYEMVAVEPTADWPNNPDFPVILYRSVTDGSRRRVAAVFEQMFEHNGWPAAWRSGVFEFDHYHSTAHEVLGVYAGDARLRLGGPRGSSIQVRVGDAILIPAGVAHCRISGSDGFQVVGAYPSGQKVDSCDASLDVQTARVRIARVGFPKADPVLGATGPAAAISRG